MDLLVLVDSEDNIMGYDEKENCHFIPTRLHRAFSIFIINSKGEMLVHKRSRLKNTWPGYWTNACCSHPRKGETLNDATQRRLREELGFACPLKYIFKFQYKSDYDRKYGENEIDNVFIGFGAAIIGDVHIADGVAIGANAVVVKDVEDNCVVGGVPARVIKRK